MKKYIPIVILVLLHICTNSFSQTKLPSYFGHFSGNINKIIRHDNILYAGGYFNYVGPETGSGVQLDRTTGQVLKNNFPLVNDYISVAVPDGKGGIFIGGKFTNVGGLTRNRLAHIDSSGRVTSWNPGSSNIVQAMAISGNTLYVGGLFDSVAGQSRKRLASIDINTGNLTSWNPTVNGFVNTIEISGNLVYVGGPFTLINNIPRKYIAAIDATSGALASWAPDVTGSSVNSIIIKGTKIYIGGVFRSVNNKTRYSLAALEAGTDSVFNWNPNIRKQNKTEGNVNKILLSGNNIYAIGTFETAGTTERSNIVAIDTASGLATSWVPAIDKNTITTIAISGDTVYVGANSISTGSKIRYRIGAVDINTGKALDWGPGAGTNQAVLSIIFYKNKIFIGGIFTSAGGSERKSLAAFDVKTGQLTSWAPKVNGEVRAMLVTAGKLYLGGEFDTINGQERLNLGSVDIASGNITSWDPGAGDYVTDLKLINKTLYVSGNFWWVGSKKRNKLGAVDINTGLATDWDPDIRGFVATMAVAGNTIYIGGSLEGISQGKNNGIAALDATTGVVKPWYPVLDTRQSYITNIVVSGDTVFAIPFSAFGFEKKDNPVYAISAGSGTVYNWNFELYGWMSKVIGSVLVQDTLIYIGGYYDSIDGKQRVNLSSISKKTGKVTSWSPTSDWVELLYAYGDTLYASGSRKIEHYSFKNVTTEVDKVADNIRNGQNLLIYPNPTRGEFSYYYSNSAMNAYSVEVYDAMGKMIFQKQESSFTESIGTVQLSGKPAGIYLVKISNGKNSVTKKLVLKK